MKVSLIRKIIIKEIDEIKFYSLEFFKASFLQLWVNDVVVLKMFSLLLNLLKADGPLNEILFWHNLFPFSKVSISKAICYLVFYIFWDGEISSFPKNGKFLFQYLKLSVAMRCSTLFCRCLNKGYQEIQAKSRYGLFKELYNNIYVILE